ncbi:MAG: hypothetical protein J5743_03115, partial [Victivallales bacterium]|nr:hypothetical protein [Victivallales bacterium]
CAALLAALVLLFRPWRWLVAAIPAFVGLLMLHASYYIAVPTENLIFWGVCTAMVAGLTYLSPPGEPDGRQASNLYIGASTIAGCLLGMIVGARFMVLGVVIGAFVGQLAYSRTPAGRWMRQPVTTFLQYFAAKCLPAIVAVAQVGIAIEGFIV